MLAAVETVVTFNVAYGASTVLGTVLLQTSPERGLSGGRMEAFLRAMREVTYLHFNPPRTETNNVRYSRSNATPISSIFPPPIFGNSPPPSPDPPRTRTPHPYLWSSPWSFMSEETWRTTTCWNWPGGHGKCVWTHCILGRGEGRGGEVKRSLLVWFEGRVTRIGSVLFYFNTL